MSAKRITAVLLALAISLTLFVFPTSAIAKTKQQEIDEVVNEIMSLIKDDMSDFEKVLILNDWIVTNVRYDTALGLYGGKIGYSHPDGYNEYGALVEKLAVCDGYTDAFSLLLDKAGLENKHVVGQAENFEGWGGHAWNMVKVDNKWYHVDVTWNGVHDYQYFLVSDEFLNQNHRWDKKDYPTTPKNSFFGFPNKEIGKEENPFMFFNTELQRHGDIVIFLKEVYPNDGGEDYSAFDENMISIYDIKNKTHNVITKKANDKLWAYFHNIDTLSQTANDKYIVFVEDLKLKVYDINKNETSDLNFLKSWRHIQGLKLVGDTLYYFEQKYPHQLFKSYNINTKTIKDYGETIDNIHREENVTSTSASFCPEIINNYLVFYRGISSENPNSDYNDINYYFYSVNVKTGEYKRHNITSPYGFFRIVNSNYTIPSNVYSYNCTFNNKLYFSDYIDIYCFNTNNNKLTKLRRPNDVDEIKVGHSTLDIEAKAILGLRVVENKGKAYLQWDISSYNYGLGNDEYITKQREIK